MRRRLAVVGLAAGLAFGCGGSDGGSPGPATAPTPTPEPAVSLTTIAQLTRQGINTGPITAGQSLTISGAYDNLRFRFLVPEGGEPANGELFLFNREYLGPPRDMGPGTAGFVASTLRLDDGEWVFDPGVRVADGQYWFMAKSPMRIYTTPTTADFYPGGDVYTAGILSPFVRFYVTDISNRIDALFQLRGNLVPR